MAAVASSEAWRHAMDRLCVVDRPGFFALRTALPVQGRTNLVAAANPGLNVVLKSYATGGESELHAHTNEDHVFVVLQGGATFFGPRVGHGLTRSGCSLPAGTSSRTDIRPG